MSIKRYDTFYESQPFENIGGRYVLYSDHCEALARLMEKSMDGVEDVVAYEVRPLNEWMRVEPVGDNRMRAMFGPPRSPHDAEDECGRLNEAFNLGRKSILNSESLDRSSLWPTHG